MKYGIKTIDDFDVRGKTVPLRVDMNQPVNSATGELEDITRIQACAPTIKEQSDKGAKLAILAHQSSDVEYQNYHNLKPHAKVLSALTGKHVTFVPDVVGPYAQGKTLGLVGFGKIPRLVKEKSVPFGMNVIIYNPYVSAEQAAEAGVKKVEIDELIAQSDFISIHCPLTPETRGMFDAVAF